MNIRIIDGEFSVTKTRNFNDADLNAEFCFACKTDREFSLVTKTNDAPKNFIKREDGWRAMAIDGQLDFSLVGILSKICDALAEKNVALFAVSTYDTDYVLVKAKDLSTAIAALKEKGFNCYA